MIVKERRLTSCLARLVVPFAASMFRFDEMSITSRDKQVNTAGDII
ncbi:hypothetical protein SMQE30_15010 [Serratia marcescens]|nr:hypothetical protein SMQE30_15010 [Serratia marcescens]